MDKDLWDPLYFESLEHDAKGKPSGKEEHPLSFIREERSFRSQGTQNPEGDVLRNISLSLVERADQFDQSSLYILNTSE